MTDGLGKSALWPVQWFDEIDSTNAEAGRRAATGSFTDTWLAAHTQTAGRGRLGRKWVSPPGNLYSTALFHHAGPLREIARIPFVAGLAVSDVIGQLAPDHEARLKWPNDVRVDGAKLAGILIEAGTLDEGVWVAAGFGVNVQHAPENVGQDTSCLAALRGDNALSAADVLDALRSTLKTRLAEFDQSFSATRIAWLDRAEGLGKPVRIKLGDKTVEGIFEDMADDGALILRLPDGSRQTIRTGDVELIRKVS